MSPADGVRGVVPAVVLIVAALWIGPATGDTTPGQQAAPLYLLALSLPVVLALPTLRMTSLLAAAAGAGFGVAIAIWIVTEHSDPGRPPLYWMVGIWFVASLACLVPVGIVAALVSSARRWRRKP